MSSLRHAISAVCLGLVALRATPSGAAGTAWLARAGGGSSCSLAAPCASMQSALSLVGPGGEIICLDRGSYGGGAILQSVTISCGDGLWEALGGPVGVLTPAGADVFIEGLVSDGNYSSAGTVALTFSGQGSLRLRRVRLGNSVGQFSHGLLFQPNGPATLHVSGSVFYHNGGSGILVRPQPGGYANAHVRDVKFERNLHGLFADGGASSTGINVNISDSLAAENEGNGFGVTSVVGKAQVTMSLARSHISGNLANGLGAAGAALSGPGSATIAVGGSMITANANGLAIAGAGQILTYGNNKLRFNGNNGAFTGATALQ